jgi:hypothetical protein
MDLGLLEPAAPAAARCDRRWLEHHLEAATRLVGSAPHPLAAAIREAGSGGHLALLLRGWGSPDADTVAGYAWPRTTRRSAAHAAALLDRTLTTVGASAAVRRSFIHSAGTAFPATLAFAAAIEPDRPWARWWRQWREQGQKLVNPKPLLSGEEIAAVLELEPGPDLGHAVDALTEAQVQGQVKTAAGARGWLRRTFER